MYVCKYMYLNAYINNACMSASTCTWTNWLMHTCVQMHVCEWIHECVYLCKFNARMYANTSVWMNTSMHVCMYIHACMCLLYIVNYKHGTTEIINIMHLNKGCAWFWLCWNVITPIRNKHMSWARCAEIMTCDFLRCLICNVAFQVSEAECAEKQQVGKEKIQRLELELSRSRGNELKHRHSRRLQ